VGTAIDRAAAKYPPAMTEIADRYRRVAEGFTTRVDSVSPGDWDRPSPCEDWTARDVVGHVADVSHWFLQRAGVELDPFPAIADDPAATWGAARDAMQAALEDPSVAEVEYDTPMGRGTLEKTIGMVGVGDLLVHTWDLARATGQDDRLHPDEVHLVLEGMIGFGDGMRQGSAFGPAVAVPDDADEQTKLVAFSGRQP
jgi:uncharacterized protein (TIGR03086 family)